MELWRRHRDGQGPGTCARSRGIRVEDPRRRSVGPGISPVGSTTAVPVVDPGWGEGGRGGGPLRPKHGRVPQELQDTPLLFVV